MKKVFFLFVVLVSFSAYSQKSDRNDLYYKKVKEFYNGLLKKELSLDSVHRLFDEYLEFEEYFFFEECDRDASKNCLEIFKKRLTNPKQYPSVFFKKIVNIKELLLPSCYDNLIDSLVNNSVIYDENLPSDISVDVFFPNGKMVCFYLNKYADEPVYITNIYISNGESFYNYLLNGVEGVTKKYLKRLALIDDPDGYTNVRKGKGYKYPVIHKIKVNEEFLFTPNSNCNWWRVQNKDGLIKGYMHKSRIKPLGHYIYY
ncbi:MAG: SH3 domain-containing protein [Carboxylicivirga sp.]|jgi:hypothetical protein|nr:SH3 domain-containing protein [Carboxylicivirga sp.]